MCIRDRNVRQIRIVRKQRRRRVGGADDTGFVDPVGAKDLLYLRVVDIAFGRRVHSWMMRKKAMMLRTTMMPRNSGSGSFWANFAPAYPPMSEPTATRSTAVQLILSKPTIM